MMTILDLMTRRRGKLYQPRVPKLKVKSGVGEEATRKLFELYCGKPFVSVRPDWLKNPQTGRNLELDGYNEELALAFEFDGEHHTKDGYFWDYDSTKQKPHDHLFKKSATPSRTYFAPKSSIDPRK